MCNKGGNRKKKAAFHTLGCRVNAYETEAMEEQLKADGFEIVPFGSEADVYIVNTCTVTGIADRKSRQMLHRAKEKNPGAVIVAAGCYVEDAGETLLHDEAPDLIIGNQAKASLAEILRRFFSGDPQRVYTGEIRFAKKYEEMPVTETRGRTRAFLKIQDGCNQFCSYCIIPYVRGRVRSRAAEEAYAEAERLTRAGYREIVLTGIHVSSYGIDFDAPGENRQTPDASYADTNRHLLELAGKIASLPGVERLRFGSLEPGIMTEEFVRELAGIPEICPQFHLSLQSGSDTVLVRMKRKYTTAAYEEICGRLRTHFHDPAITTDLIAGFPGETEEEFSETVSFVKKVGFAKTHIFKYSKREGTKAASMPGQIDESVKRQRSDLLIELDRQARAAYARRRAEMPVEVLFEERQERGGILYDTGHTREALDVLCVSETDLSGQIFMCRADRVLPDGTIMVTPV